MYLGLLVVLFFVFVGYGKLVNIKVSIIVVYNIISGYDSGNLGKNIRFVLFLEDFCGI